MRPGRTPPQLMGVMRFEPAPVKPPPDTPMPDREICGAWMQNAKQPCARKPGHKNNHRTALAMAETAAVRRTPYRGRAA